jgi:hypothetical protein
MELGMTWRSDSDTLAGEVHARREPARPFIGWIGLLSALEAAIGPTGKDRVSRSSANPPTTGGDGR